MLARWEGFGESLRRVGEAALICQCHISKCVRMRRNSTILLHSLGCHHLTFVAQAADRIFSEPAYTCPIIRHWHSLESSELTFNIDPEDVQSSLRISFNIEILQKSAPALLQLSLISYRCYHWSTGGAEEMASQCEADSARSWRDE